MKLFYSPGACSLAPHIALKETGLTFDLEPVNMKTKHFRGGDYNTVNPKGYVPAIEFNGQVLTEGAVILQYIADQKPDLKLIPKPGTMDRYRCQEWLNFISTEVHKGFSPLWNPKASEETKAMTTEKLGTRFNYLNEHLTKNKFLMGTQYTVADTYLFTVLNWAPMLKLDMAPWPKLLGYYETVKNRPATQEAFKAEGLNS